MPPGTRTLGQGLLGCDASTLIVLVFKLFSMYICYWGNSPHQSDEFQSSLVAHCKGIVSVSCCFLFRSISPGFRLLASTQRKQHTFCLRSCIMPLCWNTCRIVPNMALRAYADGQISSRRDSDCWASGELPVYQVSTQARAITDDVKLAQLADQVLHLSKIVNTCPR